MNNNTTWNILLSGLTPNLLSWYFHTNHTAPSSTTPTLGIADEYTSNNNNNNNLVSWMERLLILSILTLCMIVLHKFMKFIYGILFEPLDRVIDLEHNHTHTTISHSSHHLASRYRKRLGEFPPVYPNGWFKVCNSWELKPGQVKYVRMLGLELALYRGEKSHRAYALDAYCTHLGANLTVGGQVHGECLTCPFHHWSFKGENGQCVSLGNIPIEMPMIKKNGKLVQHLQVRDDSFQDCQKVEYCEHRDVAAQLNEKSTTPKDILIQTITTTTTNTEEHKHSQNSKIPSQANTKSYILEEKNDQIYLWFDAEGRPPHWKVPSVRPNLKTHGKLAHHIYCHIQEIPENGPDAPQEMKYTFGWIWNIWGAKWQKSTLEHQDHIAYFQVQHVSTFNDLFNIPFSVVDVNGGQYGPGIVMFEFSTPLGSFDLIQTVTPVGPLHQHVEHVIYCPWFIPRWFAKWFLIMMTSFVEQDIPIWNNKTYLKQPVLVRNDGPIAQFRRWFSQFYSENSPTLESLGSRSLDW